MFLTPQFTQRNRFHDRENGCRGVIEAFSCKGWIAFIGYEWHLIKRGIGHWDRFEAREALKRCQKHQLIVERTKVCEHGARDTNVVDPERER